MMIGEQDAWVDAHISFAMAEMLGAKKEHHDVYDKNQIVQG